MKKTFPILFTIFVFSSFLVAQVIFDTFDIGAKPSTREGIERQHFEGVYQKLKIKTITGKKIELSKVKAPIVIVNFWASWCLPCIKEFKSLNGLIDKLGKKKLLVVGINSDAENPKQTILKTQKKHKLLFDSIVDSEGTVAEKFMVSSLPYSIIYANGKFLAKSAGEFNFLEKGFLKKLQDIK
ncbi:MAG: TlpA family protein disulfide reductase [Bacteriovoracaceae bacterium]|jgi:thiol-disulfide isomerase/thioredoxin|nr:TlpA family protein disulfide reductase [Bacteriovoracaceae bacterium]